MLLQGRHRRLGPAGAPTDFGAEGMEEHIGGRHTAEPELVGFEPVTGRPITLQIQFMIFNILLVFPPRTIDLLIQHPPPGLPAIGRDRPDIPLPGGGNFHLHHQVAGVGPRGSLIRPTGIPGLGLSGPVRVSLDSLDQTLDSGIRPEPVPHGKAGDRV